MIATFYLCRFHFNRTFEVLNHWKSKKNCLSFQLGCSRFLASCRMLLYFFGKLKNLHIFPHLRSDRFRDRVFFKKNLAYSHGKFKYSILFEDFHLSCEDHWSPLNQGHPAGDQLECTNMNSRILVSITEKVEQNYILRRRDSDWQTCSELFGHNKQVWRLCFCFSYSFLGQIWSIVLKFTGIILDYL